MPRSAAPLTRPSYWGEILHSPYDDDGGRTGQMGTVSSWHGRSTRRHGVPVLLFSSWGTSIGSLLREKKRSHDEEQPSCCASVSGRPEGSSLYQLWTLVLQTVHQLILGPVCFIRRLLPVPSVEKDPEPELDCRQPVRPAVYKVRLNICLLLSSTGVGLQEVLDEHKISLRRRCERVTEGSDEAGSETLLNRIYTELYITEGHSEEVHTQHEVRQLETASKMKTLHDTPIKCHDIFKALPDQQKHIRVVLTNGVAGVGKTFSVQKFTLDWAEGLENQDVSLLILLFVQGAELDQR
ncbi:hypothetical protein L3Q82_018428 [Scortum barcoo]|uniref:Uncharacterized protein n=1 Tax=Scortum barcoo TaxID=214431 RepID=A0ACB8VM47_9TELE|nr:hypothetical protein L3Q82_018428 [Scortum barcoo]